MTTTIPITPLLAAYIKELIPHYKECALWASTDTINGKESTPLDSIETEWSKEALDRIEDECTRFVTENKQWLADWPAEQAGHDFFLSRNGHGAGFFDRDLPYAEELQKAAEKFGESDPYIGDDGLLYLS